MTNTTEAMPRQGAAGPPRRQVTTPRRRDAAQAAERKGQWWNRVDASLPAVAGSILKYWIALESFVRDDPDDSCWPGNQSLVDAFGLSGVKGVQRILQRLEDLGLIRREG